MHGGKPWMTSYDNPFVQAAGRAIEKGFGRTPIFTREGGSIPVVSTFQEELGLPSVLFGVGLPDENAHAPNEKLDLGNFHNGIIASAFLYEEIGVPEPRTGYENEQLSVERGDAAPERLDVLPDLRLLVALVFVELGLAATSCRYACRSRSAAEKSFR